MVFILIENKGATLQLENGMIAYWTLLSFTFKIYVFFKSFLTFFQQKSAFSCIVKIEAFKTHPKVHEKHLSNCIVNAGCKRSILKSSSEKWSSTFSQSNKITNCFLCVIATDKSAFNSLSLCFCCKMVTSVLNFFLATPSRF